MKVLMVNKFLHPAGGAETYVLQVGKWLEEHGHEVMYYGMDHPERVVGNNLNLYASPIDFHTGSLKKRFSYLPHVIRSEESKKKLLMILKSFRPDIIHINNFNYQLTPTILEACYSYKMHRPKSKVILTAHDTQLVCPNHMLYNPGKDQRCDKCIGGHFYHCTSGRCIHGSLGRSLLGSMEAYYWNYKKIYAALDCIICPSQFMKATLDTNPLLKSKTKVLLNYIREMDIPTVDINREKPYVLYFGRLSVEKGILPLAKSMESLPCIRFLVAGAGPLEESIAHLPNVEYVGFKNGVELVNLIKGALFTICPSVCYENCPFSVLESIKIGTPVLGSRIGGIPELIREGKNGMLVEAGNDEELANKIEYLWNHEDMLDKMREELRVNTFDDLNGYGNKLLRLYYGDN